MRGRLNTKPLLTTKNIIQPHALLLDLHRVAEESAGVKHHTVPPGHDADACLSHSVLAVAGNK